MVHGRTLPELLLALGYTTRTVDNTLAIVPPVCCVPAGAFLMGSEPSRDNAFRPDELPQHGVTLPGFEMARYPVTVAEYQRAVAAGAVSQPWNWQRQLLHVTCPVVNVAWQAAVDYAAWLACYTGEAWRIPSEAEWEKGARGSDGRIYPWGDRWNPALAIIKDTPSNTYKGIGPSPVGQHPGSASPFGVEDLVGNVWEWTISLHYPYPYDSRDGREDMGVAADIQDQLSDERHARIMRGGSWDDAQSSARTAMRGLHVPPWNIDGYIGFRLVCG